MRKAHALTDVGRSVTVLERDAFPQSDIPRKGVPQGCHAHGLLARGRKVRKPGRILFAQIVAVGFRDDLPAVAEFHRHQIIGEIARR